MDAGAASVSKLRWSGIGYLFLSSLAGIPAIAVFVTIAIDRSNGIRTSDGSDVWIPLFVGVPMLLIAWPFFATAVRRFRAMGGSWYLRAGPGGVAYRLPGRSRWKSLLFGQGVIEGAMRWDQITRWYPFVVTMNGIPTASVIVFQCADGGSVRANTIYFAESREQLVQNVSSVAQQKFSSQQ